MKKHLSIFLMAVFLFFAFPLIALENTSGNPRVNRRLGVGIQLGGPTLICSAQVDYFLTPAINFEAGAGLVGLYSGVKIHLSQSNWSPYLGVKVTFLPELKLFGGGEWNPGLYVPFGMQYLSRDGFTFAFEAALLLTDGIGWGLEPFWAGLKFGYHF
ncbi:MAG: hypothetical protein SCM96_00180 [Acidobacteriota bacterium]|nr:hypothetical protein [Acidobacteriota bacterium]